MVLMCIVQTVVDGKLHEQMVGGTVKFTMFIEYKCGAKTNGISKQDQISYQENNKKKKTLYTQVNVQS